MGSGFVVCWQGISDARPVRRPNARPRASRPCTRRKRSRVFTPPRRRLAATHGPRERRAYYHGVDDITRPVEARRVACIFFVVTGRDPRWGRRRSAGIVICRDCCSGLRQALMGDSVGEVDRRESHGTATASQARSEPLQGERGRGGRGARLRLKLASGPRPRLLRVGLPEHISVGMELHRTRERAVGEDSRRRG